MRTTAPIVAISALLLAGCGTASAQDDAFVAAREQVFQQCNASTPEAARRLLGAKLAIVAGGEPTLQMLADQSKPTPAEKQALELLLEQRDRCRANIIDVHERFGHGPAASVYRVAQPAIRSVYAALYGDEITYGEANRRFDELQSRVADGIGAYGRALDAQAAADAERRRLDALQVLQQWSAGNRPSSTECVRVGMRVQCATR